MILSHGARWLQLKGCASSSKQKIEFPLGFTNGCLPPNVYIDLHDMNDISLEQTKGWDTGHTSLCGKRAGRG